VRDAEDVDVRVDPATKEIRTQRLRLRTWTPTDAPAALEIYRAPEVARWLAPAMDAVTDLGAMRGVLDAWAAQCRSAELPQGRWAVEDFTTGTVIGGVSLMPLPPGCTDLEIGWQIAPRFWGQGYGSEAGHGVAHQAFESRTAAELFAVVRPGNTRGIATARRVGMEWVGETSKYYDMTLQIYRLTKADLDYPAWGRPINS
jgi:RimJ/RimL family protein N-acetyltransferase